MLIILPPTIQSFIQNPKCTFSHLKLNYGIVSHSSIIFQLNDLVSEFEKEKFEMQKSHTRNIQEILDDTNGRLQKMEMEYNKQTTSTVNIINIHFLPELNVITIIQPSCQAFVVSFLYDTQSHGTIKVGVFSTLVQTREELGSTPTSLQTHFKNISSAYSA